MVQVRAVGESGPTGRNQRGTQRGTEKHDRKRQETMVSHWLMGSRYDLTKAVEGAEEGKKRALTYCDGGKGEFAGKQL